MSAPKIVEIRLDQIDCSNRLRAIDVSAIEMLAASMEVDGVRRLLQPVTVRPAKSGFKLVTGGHRIEAARSLGWEEISCVVEDGLKEDDARIREIDENLHRQELSPYDQAEFITMRWRLWIKKNDKRAKLPQLAELTKGIETKEFYAETAGLTGVHPETIRRAVLRRRQLDTIWPHLQGTDAANSGALLDRLRKKFATNADDVIEVAARDHDGSLERAMDAIAAEAKAKNEKVSVPAEEALRNLRKAWKSCPANKKQKFVQDNFKEITQLLQTIGAEG